MSSEESALEQIKAKMSDSQRKEMADVIKNEMERRGMLTKPGKSAVSKSTLSGSLSADQVKELYTDLGKTVQQMRINKLEEKVNKAKGGSAKTAVFHREPGESSFAKSALMYSILAVGVAKILFIAGVLPNVSTAAALSRIAPVIQNEQKKEEAVASPASQAAQTPGGEVERVWTPVEKELLTQLDTRRVELEKRKDTLDKRESELNNQTKVLAERLSEVRSLTAKLADARKEKERKHESRLEQLANVYGGMEPKEASQLIAKLEDEISLKLLERMPEKRMGQILSYMEKQRAVDLTKMLTERKNIE